MRESTGDVGEQLGLPPSEPELWPERDRGFVRRERECGFGRREIERARGCRRHRERSVGCQRERERVRVRGESGDTASSNLELNFFPYWICEQFNFVL